MRSATGRWVSAVGDVSVRDPAGSPGACLTGVLAVKVLRRAWSESAVGASDAVSAEGGIRGGCSRGFEVEGLVGRFLLSGLLGSATLWSPRKSLNRPWTVRLWVSAADLSFLGLPGFRRSGSVVCDLDRVWLGTGAPRAAAEISELS